MGHRSLVSHGNRREPVEHILCVLDRDAQILDTDFAFGRAVHTGHHRKPHRVRKLIQRVPFELTLVCTLQKRGYFAGGFCGDLGGYIVGAGRVLPVDQRASCSKE